MDEFKNPRPSSGRESSEAKNALSFSKSIYVFVHHKRMGFVEKKKDGVILFDKTGNPRRGATDSIEYCHMVFQKGNCPEFAKLKVI